MWRKMSLCWNHRTNESQMTNCVLLWLLDRCYQLPHQFEGDIKKILPRGNGPEKLFSELYGLGGNIFDTPWGQVWWWFYPMTLHFVFLFRHSCLSSCQNLYVLAPKVTVSRLISSFPHQKLPNYELDLQFLIGKQCFGEKISLETVTFWAPNHVWIMSNVIKTERGLKMIPPSFSAFCREYHIYPTQTQWNKYTAVLVSLDNTSESQMTIVFHRCHKVTDDLHGTDTETGTVPHM